MNTRLLRCLLASAAVISVTLAAEDPPRAGPQRKPVVWNNADDLKSDIVTHHEFESTAMKRTIGYTIHLPPQYSDAKDKRYPVAYFLHGAGGNENADGPGFAGFLNRNSERLGVPPVICVFPNGGMSGYRDDPDTGIHVESMIIGELIPLIDRTFRTLPRRESRVIAGFSMGGGGAIHLALKHSDLFIAAASWAGSLINFRTHELPADITVEMLRGQDPTVRLLLVTGYDDQATYKAHAPFLELLTAAKYPYTLLTLRGVDHNLGLYYKHTADDFVTFLLAGIQTDRCEDKTRLPP